MLSLASCGPRGFDTQVASTTTAPVTVYTPPKVVETKYNVDTVVNGKKVSRTATIVDGATTMKDWLVTTDGEKNTVYLKGTVLLKPKEGGAPIEVPVTAGGVFELSDSTGYQVANLSPANHAVLRSLRVELSAKLMCLTEDCSEYFINLYIRHNNQKNQFYRVQVHRIIENVETPADKPEGAADETATPEENTKDGEYTENDIADGEPAYYVGDTAADLGDFEKVSKAQPVMDSSTKTPVETAGSQNSAPVPSPKSVSVVQVIGKREPKPAKNSPAAQTPVKTPAKTPEKAAPKGTDRTAPKSAETTPAPSGTKTSTQPTTPPATTSSAAPATSPAPAAPPPSSTSPEASQAEIEEPKTTFNKVLNQAIGYAYKGRLQRPDSLTELQNTPEQLGFRVMRPERKTHFATKDMQSMIIYIGSFALRNVRNYILNIGDVSYQRGGRLGQHDSHQNGLDADIAYFFEGETPTNKFQDAMESKATLDSWMEKPQWELFKSLVKSNNVDRIFIHPRLKDGLCKLATKNGEITGDQGSGVAYEALRRLRPEPSHDNHFHLRLQCSSAQKLCRMMLPPEEGAGCFPCEMKTYVRGKAVTKQCSEFQTKT